MNYVKLLNGIFIFLALSIFFGLGYLLYELLEDIVPEVAAFLLTAYIMYRIALSLCTMLTFPGSLWIWKRSIEKYYQKVFVVKTKRKVVLLKSLLKYIAEKNTLWKDFFHEKELKEIQETLSSVLNFFSKQIASNRANKKQKEMMNYFLEVEKSLKATNLVIKQNGSITSFWTFLEGAQNIHGNSFKNLDIIFENENQSESLLQHCRNLEFQLLQIISEKSTFQTIKSWLFEDIFGTLDHLRAELRNRYKCQPINLRTSENAILDCALILQTDNNKPLSPQSINKGQNHHSNILFHSQKEVDKQIQTTSLPNKINIPTIILCCPNAGYYENLCYESQWVDIYLKHGFNIFLWNYRGYGNSTGTPNPQNLRKDGEVIVDYLRETLGIEVIGCHGESMGGLVAAHLARWKQINFLCADRTFGSLFRVGNYVAGRCFAMIFRLITLWEDRVSSDYLETSCYKIITFDPKDEVIPFLCSLKHGVTWKIEQNKLGIKEDVRKPAKEEITRCWFPKKCIQWLHEIAYSIKMEILYSKVHNQLKKQNGILTKEQTEAVFQAINRIFDLFDIYCSIQKPLEIKRKQKPGPIYTPAIPMRMIQPKQNLGDFDNNTGALNQSNDITVNEVQTAMNKSGKKELEKTEEKVFDELFGSNNLQKDDKNYTAIASKQSYKELFKKVADADNSLIAFLGQGYSTLQGLEFGGIHLDTIMFMEDEFKFEAFKYFLSCLEIWGSYYPLRMRPAHKSKDVRHHQKKGIKKAQWVIKKLNQIIKEEKGKNHKKNSTDNLKCLILDDLQSISFLLSLSIQKLIDKKKNTNSFSNNSNTFNNNTSIELISKDWKKYKDPLEIPFLQDEENMKINLKYTYDYNVGHLLPLSCGHSGALRPLEVEMYEYYLKNANLNDSGKNCIIL